MDFNLNSLDNDNSFFQEFDKEAEKLNNFFNHNPISKGEFDWIGEELDEYLYELGQEQFENEDIFNKMEQEIVIPKLNKILENDEIIMKYFQIVSNSHTSEGFGEEFKYLIEETDIYNSERLTYDGLNIPDWELGYCEPISSKEIIDSIESSAFSSTIGPFITSTKMSELF